MQNDVLYIESCSLSTDTDTDTYIEAHRSNICVIPKL